MTARTRRQQIVDTLSAGPCALGQLAAALGVRERDLTDDLEHVRRSLGKRLVVHPASCDGCGHEFAGRTRLNTPSRCPECRSERIDSPWLELVD